MKGKLISAIHSTEFSPAVAVAKVLRCSGFLLIPSSVISAVAWKFSEDKIKLCMEQKWRSMKVMGYWYGLFEIVVND